MTEDETTGRNMRLLREGQGISQEGLAREMRARGFDHWRQTTVSRVERGQQALRASELVELERILGPIVESPDDVITGRGMQRQMAMYGAKLGMHSGRSEAERIARRERALNRRHDDVKSPLLTRLRRVEFTLREQLEEVSSICAEIAQETRDELAADAAANAGDD